MKNPHMQLTPAKHPLHTLLQEEKSHPLPPRHPQSRSRQVSRTALLALALIICHGVQAQAPFKKDEVKQVMKSVADWQIDHMKEVKYPTADWVNATFYLGLTKWAAVAEKENSDPSYYDWLVQMGHSIGWQPERRMYHADDICVGQTFLELYRKYHDKRMFQPTEARLSWVVAHPSLSTFLLDYSDYTTVERWTWCDALFMAPTVYARMYRITGDEKFLDFMNEEYQATYNFLFDKEEHLFYRDHRFIGQKEANGKKVFWGRGNGWVVGGLAEILRELPAGHKSRPFYENLFKEMTTCIASLQQNDGFWRASMLDPQSYPSPETSCSGFFVYALAYGINEGLLPRDTFLPVVEKGWKALCSAVENDGKLGYVQPIGHDPQKVTRELTEVYGPGAFLMAGTEILKMAQ